MKRRSLGLGEASMERTTGSSSRFTVLQAMEVDFPPLNSLKSAVKKKSGKTGAHVGNPSSMVHVLETMELQLENHASAAKDTGNSGKKHPAQVMSVSTATGQTSSQFKLGPDATASGQSASSPPLVPTKVTANNLLSNLLKHSLKRLKWLINHGMLSLR
ncbi:unnamed protein product [Cuscuta europaea]|uniref:Uncharacterized protein n=1 Tax=Cuscuta europaea TaxID=41803 RepID=A0A9P0YTJ9_CUSEU|nr:unnamed protein product [Cuscuta europaea]